MAYKATLFVGNEHRDLKTFQINYFEGRNCTVANWSDINDFGTIDSLREVVKADRHAFRVGGGQPYGGLLEMTFESSDNDDFFYDWFIPSKGHGTTIRNGVIVFYEDEDETPFKKIEFWDGWITNIAEDMCSTGSCPMTMHMRISPATIRYDKLIVVQKNWWQTDINSKGGKASDEGEPRVTKMYWMDKDEKNQIENIYPNEPAIFFAQTSDYDEGESIDFVLRNKATGSVFTLNGNVDENGLVRIEYNTDTE